MSRFVLTMYNQHNDTGCRGTNVFANMNPYMNPAKCQKTIICVLVLHHICSNGMVKSNAGSQMMYLLSDSWPHSSGNNPYQTSCG